MHVSRLDKTNVCSFSETFGNIYCLIISYIALYTIMSVSTTLIKFKRCDGVGMIMSKDHAGIAAPFVFYNSIAQLVLLISVLL